MHVSLIGMSNIGKTYWSKRIAGDLGFARIDCDAQIEKKLAPVLVDGGHRGLRGVAKWMGFPSDPQYKENSYRYIEAEQAVMREALSLLPRTEHSSVVIDTTGSVIYTGNDILQDLHANTCIIYFEASENHIKDLFKRYMAHPKPVIWDTCYIPASNESAHDTLKRCYPELLRDRMRRYRDMAHILIPFAQHKDRTTDIGHFIRQRMDRL